MADDESPTCPVTRGEVDLGRYEALDGVWRELKLGAPARRALVDAGIFTLDDLRARDLGELKKLHGLGPKALRLLAQALS